MIKDNTLHIEHKYTLNDAVTAGIEIYYKTKIGKSLPIVIGLITIFRGFVLKALFDSLADFIVLAISITITFHPFYLIWKARDFFKKSPAANSTFAYIFNQNGIEIIEDTGTKGFTPWKMIVKVDRRKKGIFIYPQPRIGQWIPIRAFASVSEIEFLEKLISENGIKYINRTGK